jgi:hypothetical protein
MPDYDDLCDELTYDELTDGLSTCSGSVNDLLDQLGVEDSRQNGCQYIQYTCAYSFLTYISGFPSHAWQCTDQLWYICTYSNMYI